MAKKKSTKSTKAPSDSLGSIDFRSILNTEGKKLDLVPVDLHSGSRVEHAISFGSLCLDLVTGGGAPPGRFTYLRGPEKGGKSTIINHMMRSCLMSKTHIAHGDAEGATDPLYMGNIWGKKMDDPRVVPYYHYLPPDTGEQLFTLFRRSLLHLPLMTEGPVQAMCIIDSLASLLPKALAEDEDNKQTARLAAMLSRSLPMLKTLVSKRRCALVYTNQIRQNPMQMFGNPEYSPGGESPKHYADLRMRVAQRSIPENQRRKGGKNNSYLLHRGRNLYVYTKVGVEKNKQFPPFKETHIRIHIGKGIDKEYDVMQYLRETGQGKYTAGKAGPAVTFGTMEHFPDEASRSLAKIKMPLKAFNKFIFSEDGTKFQKACRKQLTTGIGFELFLDKEDQGDDDE